MTTVYNTKILFMYFYSHQRTVEHSHILPSYSEIQWSPVHILYHILFAIIFEDITTSRDHQPWNYVKYVDCFICPEKIIVIFVSNLIIRFEADKNVIICFLLSHTRTNTLDGLLSNDYL